jgi:hypothetical protein
MEPMLIVIGFVIGMGVYTLIDDIISGHKYKSDAEKTEADRHAEREHDDELHRIMWE